MRFFHLSDLHLGKRVNEFSMLPDQAHILGRILALAEEERPEAVVIAGDVYDKPAPPAEAVTLFDGFLCSLVRLGTRVLAVSGNHDSPERLAFASRLLRGGGVYLSPVYDGTLEPVTLRDEFGPVRFYLLPFLKPASVRRFFPEKAIESYTDALAAALDSAGADPGERNVLVAHQFVTGAEGSDSEERSVGGADDVDAAVFDGFDYVALGHLHRPQSVGGQDRLRYCGSPLRYAFSEAGQKSVTLVELGEKGSLAVRSLPLTPLREMREIRGAFAVLADPGARGGAGAEDYLHIILTDEEEIPDAVGRLRQVYPNLMRLNYDNTRTRAGLSPLGAAEPERRTPLELFGEFYEKQNGCPLSGEQERFAAELMARIWEGTE